MSDERIRGERIAKAKKPGGGENPHRPAFC